MAMRALLRAQPGRASGPAVSTRCRAAGGLAALLWLGLAPPLPGQPPPGLELKIDLATVSVEGLEPGAQVLLFGVDRVVGDDDYPVVHLVREIVADEDGDGRVELGLDHEVPPRRVWVAVDLASGEAVYDLPAATRQRRESWRGRGLRRGAGERAAVEDRRGLLHVVLARSQKGRGGGSPAAPPKDVGAWIAAGVADGGSGDDDGALDGQLVAAIDAFTPIGESPPPPDSFLHGDWVVAVDPIAMSLVLEQVKGGGQ